MQLLQTDVEGFELAVIPVQWDDLKQPVVQTQADHTTLRIHDPDDPGLRRTADAILTQMQRSDAGGMCVCVCSDSCVRRGRTCTFPWARVMMSMLSPFCLYSRIQALYLAVKMNRRSLLSPFT